MLIVFIAFVCILILAVYAVSMANEEEISEYDRSAASNLQTARLPLRRSYRHTASPPEDYTVIDTETTGLDACTCEVIEIGAIKYRGHREIDRFHTYIFPEGPLHESAAVVNHITWADVTGAPSFSEAYEKFSAFIEKDTLVGYNIGFDVKFIQTRAEEALTNPCFDVLPMVKRFVRAADYKLVTVKKRLRISSRSHTALGDCEATAAVYQRIMQMPEVQKALEQDRVERKTRLRAQTEISPYEPEYLRIWRSGEQERLAGNLESALSLFDKAKEASGERPAPCIYESCAKIYRKQKEYEKEIILLDEAIDRVPVNSSVDFQARRKRAEELFAIQQRRDAEERQRAEKRAAREERRRLEEEDKRNRTPPGRSVVQIDENGVVIKKFQSVAAAAQDVGISSTGIRSAASGKQKHAGGFCWKYADEFLPNPPAPADLAAPRPD